MGSVSHFLLILWKKFPWMFYIFMQFKRLVQVLFTHKLLNKSCVLNYYCAHDAFVSLRLHLRRSLHRFLGDKTCLMSALCKTIKCIVVCL
ncbi:hypothetical protein COW95_03650 [Candidatus Peregrinibacteria bacterium CG22_combo_CG10-13_8_21_14_all_49_11]|nr:MAG: hypothetical protein COW95_03650 [Candidatus Peregrinibacteria bacterium CG22_combo_CG10-13_8_21_14_all_49_11]